MVSSIFLRTLSERAFEKIVFEKNVGISRKVL